MFPETEKKLRAMSDADRGFSEMYVATLSESKSLADFIEESEATTGEPFALWDVIREFGKLAEEDESPSPINPDFEWSSTKAD